MQESREGVGLLKRSLEKRTSSVIAGRETAIINSTIYTVTEIIKVEAIAIVGTTDMTIIIGVITVTGCLSITVETTADTKEQTQIVDRGIRT